MDGSLEIRVEVVEVLLHAAAFFAVTDLADLFGREFFFVAAFFATGHDGAEGLDFSDDGGEIEFLNLRFDGLGILVGDGRFGEIGFSVKPANIDVFGVMFDEVAAVVGSAMLFQERGSGKIATGPVGGEGVEVGVVIAENEEDGGGHVERDQSEEGTALVIFPGRGGAFSVEEGIASFPNEVVLVAEALNGLGADAVEEAIVDGFVIGAGPAGDVLEGFPVVPAFG